MDIIPAKKVTIILDATNFDLFELCPARFNYRVNLRRALPVIHKNRALDLGSLAHIGFESYYKALAEGAKFLERLDLVKLRMRLAAANPEESNIDVEDAENLILIVQENLDFWRHEDEQLIIKAVEQPFVYTLYEDEEIRILISGKIDLLADLPALGRSPAYENLPYDHKTYSRDSNLLRLSNQFQNYAVATGSYYVRVNRVGLQKSLTAEEKHKRIPLSYDDFMLDQWKANTTNTILNHYLECVRTGIWPMNYTSCLKFNRLCEYYEVCDSSGEEAKEFKLKNNYVDMDPFDVTREME